MQGGRDVPGRGLECSWLWLSENECVEGGREAGEDGNALRCEIRLSGKGKEIPLFRSGSVPSAPALSLSANHR